MTAGSVRRVHSVVAGFIVGAAIAGVVGWMLHGVRKSFSDHALARTRTSAMSKARWASLRRAALAIIAFVVVVIALITGMIRSSDGGTRSTIPSPSSSATPGK